MKTTKNYREYLQYKQLKETLDCKYKDIDLLKALSVEIVDTMVCKQQKTLRNILVVLFRRLDIKPLYAAMNLHKTVFTFDAPNRKDHWDLITAMSKNVEDATIVSLRYYYKLWFNPVYFIKYYFRVARKIKTSLKNRVFITARCLFFIRLIQSLHKTFDNTALKAKIYVPFISSAYTESCLTLFFKQKGLKTFNLFHCIFGRYQMSIPNDVIAGENINAEHILAFNETQKHDLITDFGIEETKISVAGNPKYPMKNISIKNSFQSGIILGGAAPYDKYLEQLLSLIDNFSETQKISFYLKPHPLSKITNSKIFKNCNHIKLIDKTITLKEIFASEDYDFAITHNTSSYYECMCYGILPLRWNVGENVDYEGFDDKFCDEVSLMQIIEKYKNEDKNTINEKITKLLINSYGMGINNYRQLIQ